MDGRRVAGIQVMGTETALEADMQKANLGEIRKDCEQALQYLERSRRALERLADGETKAGADVVDFLDMFVVYAKAASDLAWLRRGSEDAATIGEELRRLLGATEGGFGPFAEELRDWNAACAPDYQGARAGQMESASRLNRRLGEIPHVIRQIEDLRAAADRALATLL